MSPLKPYDGDALPFGVQLADPSASFYDMSSGLDLFGDKQAICDNMTPLTRSWLQQGALMVVVDEDIKLPEVDVAASTQEAPEAPAPASEASEPVSEDPAVEDATQEEAPEAAPEEDSTEESTTDEEEGPSLDSILSEAPAAPKPPRRHR